MSNYVIQIKNMSKNKILIHQFNPTIYPRLLWIVKGKNALNNIKNYFMDSDGDEISLNKDIELGFGAITIPVISKKDNRLGVLIWLKSDYTINAISHESVHFASSVFYDCGMTMGFTDGRDEHYAYLVGFAADCINQVITNKFKE